MTEDLPRRPNDHHVEPLFAGLGHGEDSPRSGTRRGALLRNVLLVVAVAALAAWWLA